MTKPKGGRRLRAPYQTIQVRCPIPIKAAVMHLIKQFHQTGNANVNLYASLPTEPQSDRQLGIQPSANAGDESQIVYLNTSNVDDSKEEQLQLLRDENNSIRASLQGAETATSELETKRKQLEQEVDSLQKQLELVKSESALQIQQLQASVEQLTVDKEKLQQQIDKSRSDAKIANADILKVLKKLQYETTPFKKGGGYLGNNGTGLKNTVIDNFPLLERALKQLEKNLTP